jgi:RNAse (barnase) inhibitor barstar
VNYRLLDHWKRVECLLREGIRLGLENSADPELVLAAQRAEEYLDQNELGLACDECKAASGANGVNRLIPALFAQAAFEMAAYDPEGGEEARRILDFRNVKDWDSFHRECADQLDFPDYYGSNMNAWIDCIEDVATGPGLARLVLRMEGHRGAIFTEAILAVVECVVFINTVRRSAKICLDISSLAKGGQP